jgi:hypothetical protein
MFPPRSAAGNDQMRFSQSFGFLVQRVFSAETAVFVELQFIWRGTLVLGR